MKTKKNIYVTNARRMIAAIVTSISLIAIVPGQMNVQAAENEAAETAVSESTETESAAEEETEAESSESEEEIYQQVLIANQKKMAEAAAKAKEEEEAAQKKAQEEAEAAAKAEAEKKAAAAKADKNTSTQNTSWTGAKLNAYRGTVNGPTGKEVYYNMNMSQVVRNLKAAGYKGDYWVRSDGVKMFGNYVMCAAAYSVHPYGSIVSTTLGNAIVCDTGTFIYMNTSILDIAVTW